MRMAKSSPSWSYDRIQGAMANFGHKLAPNTVKQSLKEHGIEPAPLRRRRTTGKPARHWRARTNGTPGGSAVCTFPKAT